MCTGCGTGYGAYSYCNGHYFGARPLSSRSPRSRLLGRVGMLMPVASSRARFSVGVLEYFVVPFRVRQRRPQITNPLPPSTHAPQTDPSGHAGGQAVGPAGARRFYGATPRACDDDWPEHEILPLAALSPTMEQGGVAAWVKQEGDAIAAETSCSSSRRTRPRWTSRRRTTASSRKFWSRRAPPTFPWEHCWRCSSRTPRT